jgi:hypothetical protein
VRIGLAKVAPGNQDGANAHYFFREALIINPAIII